MRTRTSPRSADAPRLESHVNAAGTRRPHDRRWLAIFGMCACLLSLPGSARADCCGTDMLWLGGGVFVGAPSALVFGVADVAFASKSRWLPRGWAIAQLALPAASNLALGILWAATDPYTFEGMQVPLTIIHLVGGTWFLIHGILSLVFQDPPGRQVGSGHASRRSYLLIIPTVPAPSRGKGALAVAFGATW